MPKCLALVVYCVALCVQSWPGSASSAEMVSRIDLSLGTGEYFSAWDVSADNRVGVVISGAEGGSSRLLLIDVDGSTATIPLPIGANRLLMCEQTKNPSTGPAEIRFFVSGQEVKNGVVTYVDQLIRVDQGSSLEVEWSSASLSFLGDAGEDATIEATPHALVWAALRTVSAGSEVSGAFGEFSGYQPTGTFSIATEMTGEEGETGLRTLSEDFPGIAILDPQAQSPTLAVLGSGMLHIVRPGQNPLAAIAPVDGGEPSGLKWQPSERRLWVGVAGGYVAYEIPNPTTFGPSPLGLTNVARIDEAVAGAKVEDIVPLADGSVLVITNAEPGLGVSLCSFGPNGLVMSGSEALGSPGSIIASGTSGQRILVLDGGIESGVIEIYAR